MNVEHKWAKGDRVRAPFEDGKSYAARIESIADETCLVTFLRHGETAEVQLSTLQPYIPADAHTLDKGTTVWAIWPQDGLFYEAVIDAVLPNQQYRVKFDGYDGDKAVLPLYDIRSRKPREQNKELPDKAIIPENLRILPTDSDKVRSDIVCLVGLNHSHLTFLFVRYRLGGCRVCFGVDRSKKRNARRSSASNRRIAPKCSRKRSRSARTTGKNSKRQA